MGSNRIYNKVKLKMKKFVSLLSGGLDSPIASYMMIQKGLSPIFLSFLTSDDLNQTLKGKIYHVISKLREFSDYKIRSYLITHDPNLENFVNICERKLTCILCKRFMLKIAMRIAKMEATNIIVTGDIMGEQASQTLDNIFAYNDILQGYIVVRPLIGLNKNDIITLNKELGLYDLTSLKTASCQYNPQYPETHAKPNDIRLAELKLDIQSLITNSLNSAEISEF
jgi:thiamine biosynthesis protein ThiI